MTIDRELVTRKMVLRRIVRRPLSDYRDGRAIRTVPITLILNWTPQS
jgi:hypothetical protein